MIEKVFVDVGLKYVVGCYSYFGELTWIYMGSFCHCHSFQGQKNNYLWVASVVVDYLGGPCRSLEALLFFRWEICVVVDNPGGFAVTIALLEAIIFLIATEALMFVSFEGFVTFIILGGPLSRSTLS